MPGWCSASSCSNERTVENRTRGITFHKFPKDKDARKKWEVALRRNGFTASNSSVLCCKHFKEKDFDRTGQIVRLRDGVIPSIFNFPAHLQKLEKVRNTRTSRKAEESLPVASYCDPKTVNSPPQPQSNEDHGYALPASFSALKTRLIQALERVEVLEREKKNAMAREKRAWTTVKSLLVDLREKNLLNEELKEKLKFYSDLQLDFMAKQGHEYTKEYKEFALTLHLQGPKAYNYLRETQHFPLPHPQTLQRWLHSMDDKPSINKEEDKPSMIKVDNEPSINKVDDEPSTNKVDDELSIHMVDDEPTTNKVDDEPSTNKVDDEPSTNKVGVDPSTNKVDDEPSINKVDDQPSMNKNITLERRCQDDKGEYGHVELVLDDMTVENRAECNPHTASSSVIVDIGDGESFYIYTPDQNSTTS